MFQQVNDAIANGLRTVTKFGEKALLDRYKDTERNPEPDFETDVVVTGKVFPPKNTYAAFSYVFKNLVDPKDISVRSLIEMPVNENFNGLNQNIFLDDNIKREVLEYINNTTSNDFGRGIFSEINENSHKHKIILNKNYNKPYSSPKNIHSLFNENFKPTIQIRKEITDAVEEYTRKYTKEITENSENSENSEILMSNVPIFFILKTSYDKQEGHVTTMIYYKEKFYSLGFLLHEEDEISTIAQIDPLSFYNYTMKHIGYSKKYIYDNYNIPILLSILCHYIEDIFDEAINDYNFFDIEEVDLKNIFDNIVSILSNINKKIDDDDDERMIIIPEKEYIKKIINDFVTDYLVKKKNGIKTNEVSMYSDLYIIIKNSETIEKCERELATIDSKLKENLSEQERSKLEEDRTDNISNKEDAADNKEYYIDKVFELSLEQLQNQTFEQLFGDLRFRHELHECILKLKGNTKYSDSFLAGIDKYSLEYINQYENNIKSSPFTGNKIVHVGILTQFHINNINSILKTITSVKYGSGNLNDPDNQYINPQITYMLDSFYLPICRKGISSVFGSKYKPSPTMSSKTTVAPRSNITSRKTLSISNCTNNTEWIFSDSIQCEGGSGLNPKIQASGFETTIIPGSCISAKLEKINENGTNELRLKEINYEKIKEIPEFCSTKSRRTIHDFISNFDLSILSLTLHNKALELSAAKKKNGGSNKKYLLNRLNPNHNQLNTINSTKRRPHKSRSHKRGPNKSRSHKRCSHKKGPHKRCSHKRRIH